MNNISMPMDFSWSGHWCAMFSSLNKSLIAFAWRFYQIKIRSIVNFWQGLLSLADDLLQNGNIKNMVSRKHIYMSRIFQGLKNMTRICVSVCLAIILYPIAILACHLAPLVCERISSTSAGLSSFIQLLGAKAASLCLCTPMLSVKQQLWLWQDMQPFQ